jgi:hypothetical protein
MEMCPKNGDRNLSDFFLAEMDIHEIDPWSAHHGSGPWFGQSSSGDQEAKIYKLVFYNIGIL